MEFPNAGIHLVPTEVFAKCLLKAHDLAGSVPGPGDAACRTGEVPALPRGQCLGFCIPERWPQCAYILSRRRDGCCLRPYTAELGICFMTDGKQMARGCECPSRPSQKGPCDFPRWLLGAVQPEVPLYVIFGVSVPGLACLPRGLGAAISVSCFTWLSGRAHVLRWISCPSEILNSFREIMASDFGFVQCFRCSNIY